MFKDLWTLIKMLFKNKPSDVKEAELMGMDSFPFEGYSYMMWCGKLIYRNSTYERRKNDWGTEKFKITLNHETIHLAQAKAMGSWFKYYRSYLWEWIKGGIIMAPVSAAYYTIPYEMEAYGNEENFNYVENYTLDNVKPGGKYYIEKDRKKFYKSIGKNWKDYCKTI